MLFESQQSQKGKEKAKPWMVVGVVLLGMVDVAIIAMLLIGKGG